MTSNGNTSTVNITWWRENSPKKLPRSELKTFLILAVICIFLMTFHIYRPTPIFS